MAIQDLKITTYEDNIKNLSDYPSNDGVSAAQLKALFDGRTDKEIKTNFNGLVDKVDNHVGDTENPHTVTKTQVGLGNADNTSDLNKPVSTAQAAAIAVVQADVNAHKADTDNPHEVTKAQVGLGNVDNTSDLDKPVSTATQTALDLKADYSELANHTTDTDNPHSVTATQLGLDVDKASVSYKHATNAIGGANLFDQERWNTVANVEFQEYNIPLANSDFQVGGTYTPSGDVSSADVATIELLDENRYAIGSTIYISSAQSFTIPEGTVIIFVTLYSMSMSLTPDELIPIMINEGDEALPYEPYNAHAINPHNVTAAQIDIADTAEHFTAETVEDALAELATGKVGTSDIINDLTTGGATAPLSAEQGKVLNSKVNELTTYGVVSGLEVSAQSTPDMSVQVPAGVVYMPSYTRYSISAVASISIDAADATYNRYDLIYINSSGVVSYLAGTAAETPAAPSVPAGGLALAQISVAALSTTVEAAAITDRKKPLWQSEWYTPTLRNGAVTDATKPLRYCIDGMGIVHFTGRLSTGTEGTSVLTMPVGLRPKTDAYAVVVKSNGTLGWASFSSNSGNTWATDGCFDSITYATR